MKQNYFGFVRAVLTGQEVPQLPCSHMFVPVCVRGSDRNSFLLGLGEKINQSFSPGLTARKSSTPLSANFLAASIPLKTARLQFLPTHNALLRSSATCSKLRDETRLAFLRLMLTSTSKFVLLSFFVARVGCGDLFFASHFFSSVALFQSLTLHFLGSKKLYSDSKAGNRYGAGRPNVRVSDDGTPDIGGFMDQDVDMDDACHASVSQRTFVRGQACLVQGTWYVSWAALCAPA